MAQTTTKKPNLQKEFLDKAEGRLRELKPLVDEHRELEEAVAALKGKSTPSAAPVKRSPGRPRGSGSSSAKSSSRGRVGKRAQQVMAQVEKNPGIRIPELAKALKMDSAQYLYKIVPQLVEENQLVKDGKGYQVSSSTN